MLDFLLIFYTKYFNMKLTLILITIFLTIGCSKKPDCVAKPSFYEKIKEGEYDNAELQKHVVCYDDEGNPY